MLPSKPLGYCRQGRQGRTRRTNKKITTAGGWTRPWQERTKGGHWIRRRARPPGDPPLSPSFHWRARRAMLLSQLGFLPHKGPVIIQSLGVMPRLVSKSLSSRATQHILRVPVRDAAHPSACPAAPRDPPRLDQDSLCKEWRNKPGAWATSPAKVCFVQGCVGKAVAPRRLGVTPNLPTNIIPTNVT